jgi:hypothetical protein
MGVVYRARHKTLGRVVALKMMRSDYGFTDQVERFRREIQATAILTHANIVPVYEVGDYQSQPYYTMPFVGGGSLSDRREQLYADPGAVLTLLAKVAEAVHYAHEQGIVHRDLKPSNVLVNEHGEPMVTDFGLAKLRDGDLELTRSGVILGTPYYMAPEQAAGRTKLIGPATDVWALGVMLYELLAGQRPFLGENEEEVKRKIRESDPPRLRSVRPGLSAAVERMVLKCLQKKPERRYRSAKELAAALRDCLEKGPTVSAPIGWLARLLDWLPRYSIVTAGGLLCVAALVVFAFLFPRDNAAENPIINKGGYQEVLLGQTGPPEKFRWLLGERTVTKISKDANEPFSFTTTDLALLELLPRPPVKTYRLEVEIWHQNAVNDFVGVFLGHRILDSEQSRQHTFMNVSFADIGQLKGKVYTTIRIEGGKGHVHAFGPSLAFPPREVASAVRWRPLAVHVGSQVITVNFDGRLVGNVARAELEKRFQGISNGKVGFDPEGALGLYLSQGTASFRNAVVSEE